MYLKCQLGVICTPINFYESRFRNDDIDGFLFSPISFSFSGPFHGDPEILYNHSTSKTIYSLETKPYCDRVDVPKPTEFLFLAESSMGSGFCEFDRKVPSKPV